MLYLNPWHHREVHWQNNGWCQPIGLEELDASTAFGAHMRLGSAPIAEPGSFQHETMTSNLDISGHDIQVHSLVQSLPGIFTLQLASGPRRTTSSATWSRSARSFFTRSDSESCHLFGCSIEALGTNLKARQFGNYS